MSCNCQQPVGVNLPAHECSTLCTEQWDASCIVMSQSLPYQGIPINTVLNTILQQLSLSIHNGLLKATVSLSSAQILALNSTPVLIIPAVTGKAIHVISANVNYTFVSIAYTTNVTLTLVTDTATNGQGSAGLLGSTASTIGKFSNTSGTNSTTQIIPSKGLNVTVSVGNPTAGNGTAIVTVFYTLV